MFNESFCPFHVLDMQAVCMTYGRPRSFDREQAVGTVMRLFRRHGYEGVSLSMLTDGIGIATPSLYAAFGSKAGLYREAIERYAAESSLFGFDNDDRESNLDVALERMFARAIQLVAGTLGERGCMISLGLLTSHPDHEELVKELAARRGMMADPFGRDLERWLKPEQAKESARFLCAVLQGISVQAKDGASLQELRSKAEIARLGVRARAGGASQ